MTHRHHKVVEHFRPHKLLEEARLDAEQNADSSKEFPPIIEVTEEDLEYFEPCADCGVWGCEGSCEPKICQVCKDPDCNGCFGQWDRFQDEEGD